jgi:hypothetical protein
LTVPWQNRFVGELFHALAGFASSVNAIVASASCRSELFEHGRILRFCGARLQGERNAADVVCYGVRRNESSRDSGGKIA